MRNFLKIILLSCAFMVFASPVFANQYKDVQVYLNQNKLEFPDAKPLFVVSSSKIVIPVRLVSTKLGGVVDWDDKKQEVTILLNGKKIVLEVGKDYAVVNGNKEYVDDRAMVINNRVYVPLRFVVEILGYDVNWDDENYTLYITSEANQRPDIFPSRATGEDYIDKPAVAALDKNFIEDYDSVKFYYPDDKNLEFYINFRTLSVTPGMMQGPPIMMSCNSAILKSKQAECAYKKILTFYYGDRANDAWDFIARSNKNKKEFSVGKDLKKGGIGVTRTRDNCDSLIIFI